MEREEKKRREEEQNELFAILDRRCKYEETTFDDIMDAINDIFGANYRKIPEGAVVIDKVELDALRNDLINAECNLNHVTLQLEEERQRTAREILNGFSYLLELIKDNDDAKVLLNHIEIWGKEYGVEVEE